MKPSQKHRTGQSSISLENPTTPAPGNFIHVNGPHLGTVNDTLGFNRAEAGGIHDGAGERSPERVDTSVFAGFACSSNTPDTRMYLSAVALAFLNQKRRPENDWTNEMFTLAHSIKTELQNLQAVALPIMEVMQVLSGTSAA